MSFRVAAMDSQVDFHTVGHTVSAGGVGIALLSLIGWIAPVAAVIASVVAVVWYSIQIYESDSVQKWLAMRRIRRIRRLQNKIDKLTKGPAPLP